MCSTVLPIIKTVLQTVFSYKSSFFPGTKLGPQILTFIPVATVPEKTLPKAKNLDLSVVGTIFETYINKGPFGSQALNDKAIGSSYGPV